MAGPLHHDVRGDAEGEGVDDEGAAAGMGAGQLAQLLDIAVHRLVGVVREGLAVIPRKRGRILCPTLYLRMATSFLRAFEHSSPNLLAVKGPWRCNGGLLFGTNYDEIKRLCGIA